MLYSWLLRLYSASGITNLWKHSSSVLIVQICFLPTLSTDSIASKAVGLKFWFCHGLSRYLHPNQNRGSFPTWSWACYSLQHKSSKLLIVWMDLLILKSEVLPDRYLEHAVDFFSAGTLSCLCWKWTLVTLWLRVSLHHQEGETWSISLVW